MVTTTLGITPQIGRGMALRMSVYSAPAISGLLTISTAPRENIPLPSLDLSQEVHYAERPLSTR
ncbi:hypothetical protein OG21DRAFT_1509000 [Imleria badia]|nr:hypothetical protein OG21DRAFT_1509000 [Imleria badia]